MPGVSNFCDSSDLPPIKKTKSHHQIFYFLVLVHAKSIQRLKDSLLNSSRQHSQDTAKGHDDQKKIGYCLAQILHPQGSTNGSNTKPHDARYNHRRHGSFQKD